MLFYLLAILPILALVLLSLWKNLKVAVIASFVLTSVLFFVWQTPVNVYFVSLFIALLSSVTILMIVFGAMFLYKAMEKTGYINEISASMKQIHPSREVNFFLIAIGLTAFFEGVAGFGTPGTIVPLLLISLGFNAILSVSVVLLLDSLFAIAGAVGTPVLSGLAIPLQLSQPVISSVYSISSVIITITGLLVLLFIIRLYQKEEGIVGHKKEIGLMYLFFVFPLIVFAQFAGEFSVILAASVMLILSALLLKKGEQKLELKAWIPYLVLIVLLLLPKFIPPLAGFINKEIRFHNVLTTGLNATFKPLIVPLIPFLLVGIGVLFFRKKKELYLKEISQKVVSVFLVLYPAIAISQLMVNSGGDNPSMVAYISMMLEQTGPIYVLFAPLLGLVGAFITGSTTVSNLVFGASQLQTAQLLSLNEPLVLSLQLCGASLGNSICLFNIIAAATVADVKDYRIILKNNIFPALIATLVVGLCGMLMVYWGS